MNTTENKVDQNTPEFQAWFAAIVAKQDDYMKRCFPSLDSTKMTFTVGSRYIRVMRDRSAYAFIDRTTGDVFMPATWRAPAKHARGNILNPDNGLDCTGPYGIKYIAGPNSPWES